MGNIVRLGVEVLDGGELNTPPPHILGLKEAASAVNLDPREYRGAKTRTGRSTFSVSNGSGTGVKGIKSWDRQTGSNFAGATVAATNYLLYRTGTTFWSASAASVGSVHIGGTDGAIMAAVPLDNLLIVVCDGLTPAKWDGSAATMSALGGSPPVEAKYACVYVSKVMLAGNDAAPQTFYFSATNNGEQYSSVSAPNDAGSVTSQEGGGDTIQGLRACRKWMCIFYRYYVEILTGNTVFNFSIDRLADRGLVSQTGHCGTGDVCFFASDDAVWMVAGARASDITTSKVKTWYTAISDKSKITLLMKGKLLLVVDHGSGQAYACDYMTLRWSVWTDQYWESGDTSNDQVLYAGPSASTVQVQKLDTGTADNASAISVSWRTGDFPFGWPDVIKNHRDTMVHALPGMPAVTVTHYMDGASAASTESLTFSSTGMNDWVRSGPKSELRGQYLGAKFAWSGPGTLYGFAMYAEVTADSGEVPNEV